jgi:hypothetical protein
MKIKNRPLLPWKQFAPRFPINTASPDPWSLALGTRLGAAGHGDPGGRGATAAYIWSIYSVTAPTTWPLGPPRWGRWGKGKSLLGAGVCLGFGAPLQLPEVLEVS